MSEKWGRWWNGVFDNSGFFTPNYQSRRKPIFIINGHWVNYRGDFKFSMTTEPEVSLDEWISNPGAIKKMTTMLELERVNGEPLRLLLSSTEVKYRANGRPVFYLRGSVA